MEGTLRRICGSVPACRVCGEAAALRSVDGWPWFDGGSSFREASQRTPHYSALILFSDVLDRRCVTLFGVKNAQSGSMLFPSPPYDLVLE